MHDFETLQPEDHGHHYRNFLLKREITFTHEEIVDLILAVENARNEYEAKAGKARELFADDPQGHAVAWMKRAEDCALLLAKIRGR